MLMIMFDFSQMMAPLPKDGEAADWTVIGTKFFIFIYNYSVSYMFNLIFQHLAIDNNCTPSTFCKIVSQILSILMYFSSAGQDAIDIKWEIIKLPYETQGRSLFH